MRFLKYFFFIALYPIQVLALDPLDIESLRATLPEFMFNRFLGMYLWQLLGLTLLLIVSAVFFYILKWIFGKLLIRFFRKYEKLHVAEIYIKPMAAPISFLIILLIISSLFPLLDFNYDAASVIDIVLRILIPVTITIIAYRLSSLVSDIIEKIALKSKTKVDDNLVPLIRKFIKIVVVALGIIYILENTGVEITPLLAGVSIGGLAIALAAQDTIKNFFGSFTIFTDQPFDIGDWIVFDGVEGTVEEVGVRSTRVRTFYDSLVSIPNGKLADMKIDNMGRRSYRRYNTMISITYDTTPDKVEAFVEGLKKIIAIHPAARKDYYQIHLNTFASSSLDILFYVFFKVPDWTKELQAKHEVILEIIRLANRLGVRFAYPTQTMFVEGMPGHESLTPKHTGDYNEYMDKMNKFIEERKIKYSDNIN